LRPTASTIDEVDAIQFFFLPVSVNAGCTNQIASLGEASLSNLGTRRRRERAAKPAVPYDNRNSAVGRVGRLDKRGSDQLHHPVRGC